LPLPAGPPHRLGDIIAHDASWAPDGRHLAFANRRDVFLAAADGSDVRKLATADGFDAAYWIRFSPDGTRVRFSAIKFRTRDNQPEAKDVLEMAADGSGCCGAWSADGRNYFYQKVGDTWVLPEQRSLFGKVRLGNPVQLTAGPIGYGPPTPSADGKQILFTDFPYKILVVPANGGAPRQLMPADRPESIGAGAWLPDGNSIIFGSYRKCPAADITCWGIYRLDLQTQQVSKNPGSDGLLATRLSRDGHFLAALPRNQSRVMLYDDLSTQKWSELAKAFGSIAWSHDSKSIYLHLKHETRPAELVRISVPDGHVQRVLDLTGLTLAAFGTIGSVFLPMILPCSCSTGARKKSIDSTSSTINRRPSRSKN
jgi:Tol biopolymer transport system component